METKWLPPSPTAGARVESQATRPLLRGASNPRRALVSMNTASSTTCVLYKSPESVTSVTSYTPPAQGLLFPVQYWPETDPYTQSYHSGVMSRDNSFSGAVASEVSTAAPTLSSCKYLFPHEASKNRVLTDRDQCRSTTGGIARAGDRPARPMR